MNRMYLLAAACCLSVQMWSPKGRAEDGPLSCGFRSQTNQIHCDVTIDQAAITKIVLNRGRCYVGPALPADMRARFTALLDNVEFNELSPAFFRLKRRETDLLGQGMTADQINAQLGPPEDLVNTGEGPQKAGYATFFVTADQTGLYKFGDSFDIPTGGCNLLEYDMVVNGQTWTWSTH